MTLHAHLATHVFSRTYVLTGAWNAAIRPFFSGGTNTCAYKGAHDGLIIAKDSNAAMTEATHAEAPILIEYVKTKKRCGNCQRGTHLVWTFNPFLKNRICQACAKTRLGSVYQAAINRFLSVQPYREHCLSNLREPGYE